MNIRTKISGLVLALLLSAPAFAQQPRIDSIAVDEDKGELVLHGIFQNSSSAIVLVDSVSLSITLASDTLIQATIPVIGKGSAGWVSVTTNANQSNKKLLTYLHFQVHSSFQHHYSRGGFQMWNDDDTIHARTDFLSQLGYLAFSFPITKLSSSHDIANGGSGIDYKYTGPIYDSVAVLSGSISWYRTFQNYSYNFKVPPGAGSYPDGVTINFILDNKFNVIGGQDGDNCAIHGDGTCFEWSTFAPTDFPPPMAGVQLSLSIPNILQTHLSSDPVTENTEVIITLQNVMNVRMEIMDILGHVVFSDESMLAAGENRLPINTSHFTSGIYIYRLQAGGEVASVRFVKE